MAECCFVERLPIDSAQASMAGSLSVRAAWMSVVLGSASIHRENCPQSSIAARMEKLRTLCCEYCLQPQWHLEVRVPIKCTPQKQVA